MNPHSPEEQSISHPSQISLTQRQLYHAVVIGSDDATLVSAVRTLQGISRSISIFRSVPAGLLNLRKNKPIDLLIFIPGDRSNWREAVRPIDDILAQASAKPHKFCLMCGPYQGPTDRLVGTQMGWRVLYE